MCSEENSDWIQDANIVIRDIKNHVHYISIANLPSSECKIYFNITTLEMKEFCVELSVAGFQVIGEKHNSDDKREYYFNRFKIFIKTIGINMNYYLKTL
ncbi:hypothetical protein Phum_PHUM268440 [Pediculus humanus corporis]|uniref:GSKIP domain-containing protein n=1 Tax=Pediculus humanus subsp. corporis TaxID=121224 RepID=E0VKP5_PEDHC|nr:uncharacterized protein Phum_PHUM268440 [Pediculus humanus corporis]EEB13951.1 hypothetical protein Phum_PHUM268440 [Pediculus humanus corporis]